MEKKQEITTDIETNWHESVQSFDDLNLHESLLRGIYGTSINCRLRVREAFHHPAARHRAAAEEAGHHRSGAVRNGQDRHLLHRHPAAHQPRNQRDPSNYFRPRLSSWPPPENWPTRSRRSCSVSASSSSSKCTCSAEEPSSPKTRRSCKKASTSWLVRDGAESGTRAFFYKVIRNFLD